MNSHHLIWVEVSGSRSDEGHVRAVFYILIITHDVHSIFTRFFGPILHITRAIVLIITLNFSLRRAFYCKAWKKNPSIRFVAAANLVPHPKLLFNSSNNS